MEIKRNEKDVWYVNKMYMNVFDSFRLGFNETKGVRDAYEMIGRQYEKIPPQLIPLFSYAISYIYNGRDSTFNC